MFRIFSLSRVINISLEGVGNRGACVRKELLPIGFFFFFPFSLSHFRGRETGSSISKGGKMVSWFLSGPPPEDKKEDILLFPPPWHQRNGRTKEKMTLEDIKWDKGRNGRSEEIDEDSPG